MPECSLVFDVFFNRENEMRSIRWIGSSTVVLAGMALSAAAWAQQNGFLVYPKSGAPYGSAVEVVAAQCGAYDPKKGSQEVTCRLSPTTTPKNFNYDVKQQPETLIFVSPAAGCWCTWGPKGYVCVPPGCR